MAWVPGSALDVSNDNYIYAMLGAGSHVNGFDESEFHRYSISNNSWENLSDNFPWSDTDDGASLVWAGGKYLYALRGEEAEETSNWDFARYNLTNDPWDSLQTLNDAGLEPGGIGDGASLLSPSLYSDDYSGYVFALGGGTTGELRGITSTFIISLIILGHN